MKASLRVTLIIVIVFIFTSCNSELDSSSENDINIIKNDVVEVNESIINNDVNVEKSEALADETCLIFEDDEYVDVISFFDNTDTDIYDTMTFESKEAEYNNKVINIYLKERAFNPDEPIGVIARGELKLGEYYIDKNNEKIAFVVRIWNLELELPNQVYISCITFDMANKQEIGFIQYDYNENKQPIKEIFYNEDGMLVADIEYELNNHFPFSIVKEYNTSSNENKHVFEVLNRNEKFFFLSERMNQTANGIPIDYVGDIFYTNQYEDFESNSDQLIFSYDQSNRLTDITGSLVNEDFYENKIQGEPYESMLNVEIDYDIGYDIDNIHYSTPALIYGSYDSIGELYYDNLGRMIYNSYYVTSGSIERFYFYRGRDNKPFICLLFDSMPRKGEVIDEVTFMYGNYIEMYMYDTFIE
jgi:hypothetical protein